MDSVAAILDIEIFVNCPKCDYFIDLMKEDDTDGVNLNVEGHLLDQAFPSEGHWTDAHEEFKVDVVTCTKCKTKFNVKSLEW